MNEDAFHNEENTLWYIKLIQPFALQLGVSLGISYNGNKTSKQKRE